MKTNRIIWLTVSCALGIIALCVGLTFAIFPLPTSNFMSGFWTVFCVACTLLGFVANFTIVAAFIKYVTTETLDIKGIGRIKISRMQNNIQDLTNLISLKLFDGKNFHRNTLLDAFYKDSSMQIITQDPDYIKLKTDKPEPVDKGMPKTQDKDSLIIIIGKGFAVNRSDVNNINELINIAKYTLNDGNDLDKDTLAEIYRQWYKVQGPQTVQTEKNAKIEK